MNLFRAHTQSAMYMLNPLFQLYPALFALALSISLNAANKPNVVIFLTDDQGTLDVNRFGASDLHTPNMDSLADNGVSFTQAYAHTVCCPSRAALLTGRHPNRGGVQSWLQGDRNGSDTHLGNMDPSEITLAEVLREAGYRTALFGKWHLGARVGHGPLDQGFDKHFGHLSGFIDNFTHYFLHGQGYHDLYDDNEEIFRRGEYFPEMIVDEAVKYVDKHSDEPFFIMVAFNLPHYPEQPSEEFKEAFVDLEMPRQSYARVMATVDKQIGRVLEQLDDSGIRDDTIIIFSSDNGHSEENNRGITVGYHNSGYPIGHYYLAHGGGGYTGKWIGRKGTFLEGGVRVPMIISYPKELPRDVVRHQTITIMDWMPTLIELIGLPQPANPLDGYSILPIIKSDSATSRHKVLHFDWREDWAVREGDWKLIAKTNRQTGEVTHYLHNLAVAKPEVEDYASRMPELVTRLQELHEAWSRQVKPN